VKQSIVELGRPVAVAVEGLTTYVAECISIPSGGYRRCNASDERRPRAVIRGLERKRYESYDGHA